MRLTPEQFGLYLPCDFWLAWEYYLKEQERREILMKDLTRCAAARILGPFVKGGIRDVRKFWPMPHDESNEEPQELPQGEDLELEIENLKIRADKWLKG